MNSRLLYFTAFIAGSGLALVKMLVVASQLSPGSFGTYSLAIIAAGLLGYINSFGVFDAFLVRLSPAQSSNEARRVVRDSGILFSLAMSAVLSVAASAAYDFLGNGLPGAAFPAVLIAFLVTQNLFNVLMIEVQASARPHRYAWLLTAKSLLPIVIVAAWRPGDNLLFFLALDAICLAALCLFCVADAGFPKLRNFSRAELAALIREGAPFTAQNAVQNLSLNSDKWAIGLTLGSTQLGIYSLAAQLIVCGVAFASMVQVYFLPQIMKGALDGNPPIDLIRRVVKISVLSLGVSTILFAACLLFSYPVIDHFYPEYLDSISLLPITALAGIVLSSNHTDLYFRSRRLGRTYLTIQVCTLLSLVFLYGAVAAVDGSIWAYALAFVAGRGVFALISYGVAYRNALRSGKGPAA